MKTNAALPELLAGLSGHNQSLVSKQKWLKLWEEQNQVIKGQDYRQRESTPQPHEIAAGSSRAMVPAGGGELSHSVNMLQLALQSAVATKAVAATDSGAIGNPPPGGMKQLTLTVVENPRHKAPNTAGALAAAKTARSELRQLKQSTPGITNLQINIRAGEVHLWLRDYRKGFISRLDTLLGDIKVLLQNSGLKLTGVKINGEIYRRY